MVSAFHGAARRGERIRPTVSDAFESTTADVLDAAFDQYTRVDAGAPTSATLQRDRQAMTCSLIADISAQLEILDRQRQQLAEMFADVKWATG